MLLNRVAAPPIHHLTGTPKYRCKKPTRRLEIAPLVFKYAMDLDAGLSQLGAAVVRTIAG